MDKSSSIDDAIVHLRELVPENIVGVQCLSRTDRFAAMLSDGRMAIIAKGCAQDWFLI